MHESNPSQRGAGGAAQSRHRGDTHQYLTFTVGSEMFAVGILNVKEIIEYGNLTEIPMMPSFIRGVINLRGAVVPVIDLGARFSGKVSAVQRRTCIVIVEVQQDDEKHDIGIMVDAVSEVLEIPSTTAVDFIQGDCIRDAGSGTAAPVVDVAYAKQSSAGCGLRCAMRPTAAWTTGA